MQMKDSKEVKALIKEEKKARKAWRQKEKDAWDVIYTDAKISKKNAKQKAEKKKKPRVEEDPRQPKLNFAQAAVCVFCGKANDLRRCVKCSNQFHHFCFLEKLGEDAEEESPGECGKH